MLQGEKRKVCCFALDRESELYSLASEINFSAFVKRHLTEELQRRKALEVAGSITVVIDDDGASESRW